MNTTQKNLLRIAAGLLVLSFFVVLATSPAHAMKLKNQNLAELITESNTIVFGSVKSVTDGFDAKGVPFTEVSITVGSTAKGKLKEGDVYTFRQFGLLKPRKMSNGKLYVVVSPEGFPRWNAGETVMAFVGEPASITGLQTTAGMGQGKFTMTNGKLINDYQNHGMFEGLNFDSSQLSPEQNQLLAQPGAFDAATFVDLVGRAVAEQWIEKGVIGQ